MAPARALATGLGIVSDGLEMSLDELPEWEESKIKTFPVVSPTKYAAASPFVCISNRGRLLLVLVKPRHE